ncbi:MAG: MBL fold metallo-hydrolase [Gemmataceae bacterium]
MTLHFTVLASGSSGNASLVESGNYGLLIDAGLGPRLLQSRLAAFGLRFERIRAVLLTHTHADHWNDRTFKHCWRGRVVVCCHPEHHNKLVYQSLHFNKLIEAGLVLDYEAGRPITFAPGLQATPVPLDHDSGATFGFRIDGQPNLFGDAPALAYLSDLGHWRPELLDQLGEVDLLALEFNHDVFLEKTSGRPRELVARVLGDEGHLSNEQAGQLVAALLERAPGRLAHLVQLHLSRDCNRPHLAKAAARDVLAACGSPTAIHTSAQDRPGPRIRLEVNAAPRVIRPRLLRA